MEDNEDFYLERLQYYIDIGAIREAGFDENGEILFEIDEIRTKELAPELWESHMQYVDNSLIELYKDGLLDVEYDENLEATFHLTQEGFDIALKKGIIPIEDIDKFDNN